MFEGTCSCDAGEYCMSDNSYSEGKTVQCGSAIGRMIVSNDTSELYIGQQIVSNDTGNFHTRCSGIFCSDVHFLVSPELVRASIQMIMKSNEQTMECD